MSWQTGQDLAVNTGFKVNYSPSKKSGICFTVFLRGLKQQDITIKLGISQGIVSKTLKRIKNNDLEGDLRSKTRSGRPLKISPKTDRRIRRLVQNETTISSTDIEFRLNQTF